MLRMRDVVRAHPLLSAAPKDQSPANQPKPNLGSRYSDPLSPKEHALRAFEHQHLDQRDADRMDVSSKPPNLCRAQIPYIF